MKAKRLTTLSMLIALNVILSVLTPIKLSNFKLTFEAFPILIAGILLGPIDGLIVGTVGSLIYQILFSGYGLMPTTILWVIPHAVSGYLVGLYSKNHNYELNNKQTILITILSSLVVTLLNTVAIYIDAKVYGYYSFAYVFGSIIIKILTGVILAIIYSAIIPTLVKFLKKKLGTNSKQK